MAARAKAKKDKAAETAAAGAEVVSIHGAALEVREGQEWWTPAQRAALASVGLQDTPDADLMAFLHLCQATGLDPFRKEIYLIGRNDRSAPGGKKWTAQTGIDGFRHIAERTGKYAGRVGPQWCGPDGEWVDVWLKDEPPVAARVAIKRDDIEVPFYGTAMYREFVPMMPVWEGPKGNRKMKYVDGQPVYEVSDMWKKMPALMLAKCAEAQAIRAAFPRQAGGIYTPEEMDQADARDAEAARSEQRQAIAERSWRNGEPEVQVVDGEVALPPREHLLEELANQARIMGKSIAQWTTRWAAAHHKNAEDAADSELWDLVRSKRDLVAEKAAEQGVEPYLAAVPATESVEDPQNPGTPDAQPPLSGDLPEPATTPGGENLSEAETTAPDDAPVEVGEGQETLGLDGDAGPQYHAFVGDDDRCGAKGCGQFIDADAHNPPDKQRR